MNAIQTLNQIAETWGSFVFHATWQSSIVCLILLGLAIAGKRWPTPVRYGILLVALIKFAIPPGFSIPGLAIWGKTFHPDSLAFYTSVIHHDPLESTPGKPSRPVSFTANPLPRSTPFTAVHQKSPLNIPLKKQPPISKPMPAFHWKAYAMALQAAGIFTFLLYLFIQWLQLARIRKSASPIHETKVTAQFSRIKKQIGLRRSILLLSSKEVSSPIALGLIHPCIMLPTTVLQGLAANELRTVLAHELAHHARRDIWVNTLQLILTSVWWFNPLLWILNREIRKLREDCCDDYLLAKQIASENEYCQTLLHAAALTSQPRYVLLSAGLSESGRSLAYRFQRIMNRSLQRHPNLTVIGFTIVFLSAVLLIPALYNHSKSLRSGPTALPVLDRKPEILTINYSFQPVTLPLTNEKAETFLGLGTISCMDSSREGATIVTASKNGLFVWNPDQNPSIPIQWCSIANDFVTTLDISPDDRYLAAGTQNGNLLVWDTQTWKQTLAIHPYRDRLPLLTFTPDSSAITVFCSGGLIRSLNRANGEIINEYRIKLKRPVSSLCYSPDGSEFLISMDSSHDLFLINGLSGEITRTFTSSNQTSSIANPIDVINKINIDNLYLTAGQFSPDGKSVLFGGLDFAIQEAARTEVPDSSEETVYLGHKNNISCLAFSSDGKRIISGSQDGTAKVWDRETRKEIASFGEYDPRLLKDPNRLDPSNDMFHVRFLSDSNRVLIGNRNGTIEIHDLSTHQTVAALRGHTSDVYHYAVFKDWNRLLLGCSDGSVKLQDLTTGEIQRSYTGHIDYISALELSPDETKYASLDREGLILIRDVETGNILYTWGIEEGEWGRNDLFCSIAFSPDRKHLLAGDSYVETGASGNYMEIKWFDIETGQRTKTWEIVPKFNIDRKTFNREVDRYSIQTIFTTDQSKVLIPIMGKSQLWDVIKEKPFPDIAIGDGYSNPQSFSPDGRSVALAGSKLEIWDLQTGKKVETFADLERGRYFNDGCVSYSSNGKWLAAGDNQGVVTIWDVANKKRLHTVEYPDSRIGFLRFFPDNRKLLIGTGDRIFIQDISQTEK